ncbi:uncharacterized protein [Epargyreus clarus]|uniref:uncharacterized protein n=1 Tax=Epargyreus clarus TaxID=520877 RepID=UPI003C2B49EA
MLLLILIFASTGNGLEYFRRCMLHHGKCVPHCPTGMHPYHTRCDRDTMSQRTCDMLLVYSLGYTCGWSRCDCNGDMVMDEVTGHCVDLDSCPKTTHKERKRAQRRAGRRKDRVKLKKRIRFTEDDIPDMN